MVCYTRRYVLYVVSPLNRTSKEILKGEQII